ncbi:MAG TPA: hypothetical protein VGM34_03870 [Chlamydiales bacterium]
MDQDLVDNSHKNFLSHLMPQGSLTKKGGEIEEAIREYFFLATVAEEAIRSLKKGDLHHFDPLVGENACQIRAIKVALIFPSCLQEVEALEKKCFFLKQAIASLTGSIVSLNKSRISLQDLIQKESLDFILTDDEYFFVQSFLLTIGKVRNKKVSNSDSSEANPMRLTTEYMDINKLKDFAESMSQTLVHKPIGRAFAEKLVKKSREQLSLSSVHFVQKSMQTLSRIKPVLSDEFVYNHLGLSCLPCFWATYILMQKALEEMIPIVLHVELRTKEGQDEPFRKCFFYFKATKNGYQRMNPSPECWDLPALILVGNTYRNFTDLPDQQLWEKQLLEHSPIDLTLACAAAHRQYPNPIADELFTKNRFPAYEYYKQKAQEWGCSIHNASLFLMYHVFCSKVNYFRDFLSTEVQTACYTQATSKIDLIRCTSF